jgi:hypothetical protein
MADDGVGDGDDGSADTACTPDESLPCACDDGPGTQTCEADGAWGECRCDEPFGDDGEPPADPGDPPLPADPVPDPNPEPPAANEACYPGADNSGTTCLPVHTMAPLPAGYEYADGFNGDPNYRAPIALIDLQEVDPNTMLAPNFKLSEIAQVSKGRWAIVQPHAVVSLQALRDAVGAISINSGYRSPQYNAGIGGATYSRHMYGDGFDMDPLAVGLSTLEAACNNQGGMLVEYGTHVHCDFRFDAVDEHFFGAAAAAPFSEPQFAGTIERQLDGELVALAEGFDEGEPVRRWTAYDAQGEVVGEGRGLHYAPPRAAVTVEVDIGRVVTRMYTLD